MRVQKVYDDFATLDGGMGLLAIVVRRDGGPAPPGAEFFTDTDSPLQLGTLRRPRGFKVPPHRHVAVERTVWRTQEVLFLCSGRMRVTVFNAHGHPVSEATLCPGDAVMFAAGGHAVEFLEDSEVIEVKGGPYLGREDKEPLPACVPQ